MLRAELLRTKCYVEWLAALSRPLNWLCPHMMACGPAGLATDIAALAEGYRVESLAAFDTLPQTPHVELIAKLVRVR